MSILPILYCTTNTFRVPKAPGKKRFSSYEYLVRPPPLYSFSLRASFDDGKGGGQLKKCFSINSFYERGLSRYRGGLEMVVACLRVYVLRILASLFSVGIRGELMAGECLG